MCEIDVCARVPGCMDKMCARESLNMRDRCVCEEVP